MAHVETNPVRIFRTVAQQFGTIKVKTRIVGSIALTLKNFRIHL
jgi:hypothetical protein